MARKRRRIAAEEHTVHAIVLQSELVSSSTSARADAAVLAFPVRMCDLGLALPTRGVVLLHAAVELTILH